MHTKSMKIMEAFVVSYYAPGLSVLDVGSYQVSDKKTGEPHETYRGFFRPEDYTGLDVEAGPNVDLVATEPYTFPIEDETYDLVVSGQAFEHIEYPWLTIREIARVLKTGGTCCLIAPATGKYHAYPVDCYRYYPDGWRALAKWAGLSVVRVKTHWDREWSDSVLVAVKGE